MGKEPEGRTSLREALACWIKPVSEELYMLWKCTLAATVINRNIMDAVGVEDRERAGARFRIAAMHAHMVELNPETQRFQRSLCKMVADPFLRIFNQN